jgi:hypothetical protein
LADLEDVLPWVGDLNDRRVFHVLVTCLCLGPMSLQVSRGETRQVHPVNGRDLMHYWHCESETESLG